MLNLHRNTISKGENRGEMGISFVTTGRMATRCVGGIGNQARWGPSAVSKIQNLRKRTGVGGRGGATDEKPALMTSLWRMLFADDAGVFS